METREARLWVGLDWGDARHAVCVLDDSGKEVESFEAPHTAAGLEELAARLRRCGEIAGVAVETTRHLVVHKLLQEGFPVYPINPKLSKCWRDGESASAAKSFLAVSLAKGLRTLQASPDEYRERIEKLYGDQPDSGLFSSLPGAGPKLAPRLLTPFGADRQRFESSADLELLAGAVPVQRQSGKSRRVRMRHACRKDFRTALHHFAFLSLKRSAWARAFYEQARRAGQSFALALRNLARKWLRILCRIWQERRPYDEGRCLAALIRRGSPLVQQTQNLHPLTTGG